MGGKRDLRRCLSLMDDPQHLSKEIISRTETLKNHLNTFCPITIQIDECSDNETHPDTNHKQEQTNHVTKSANQTFNDDARTSSIQKTNTSKTPSPSVSPSNSRLSSPNFLEVPENSDMSLLKATAVRLKLRTRTSSFLEWRSKWLEKSSAPPQFPDPAGVESRKEKLTEERKDRINHALDWLKTELKEMQSMDQHLARQLLSLRHDIHQLRLRRSCQEHRELLDDLQSDLEEQEELSDVLDLPSNMLHDTPLKQLGVTRMNISARRFSTC
ncbi:protein FAM167B-like [Littorina saxatilis]